MPQQHKFREDFLLNSASSEDYSASIAEVQSSSLQSRPMHTAEVRLMLSSRGALVMGQSLAYECLLVWLERARKGDVKLYDEVSSLVRRVVDGHAFPRHHLLVARPVGKHSTTPPQLAQHPLSDLTLDHKQNLPFLLCTIEGITNHEET